MSSEYSSDVKFEIGHVLFIDIVGYSKLLISEQSELLQKLTQIVRGTEQFGLAETEGKLIRRGHILLSKRVAGDIDAIRSGVRFCCLTKPTRALPPSVERLGCRLQRKPRAAESHELA